MNHEYLLQMHPMQPPLERQVVDLLIHALHTSYMYAAVLLFLLVFLQQPRYGTLPFSLFSFTAGARITCRVLLIQWTSMEKR